MERVLARGDAFVTTEIDRLKRLLGKVSFSHRTQRTTTHMFVWPTIEINLPYQNYLNLKTG